MAEETKQQDNTEIKLSDGRVVKLNLYVINRKQMTEWAKLDPIREREKYDEWLGKVCGLSADELAELALPDWQRIDRGVAKLVLNPIDPN